MDQIKPKKNIHKISNFENRLNKVTDAMGIFPTKIAGSKINFLTKIKLFFEFIAFLVIHFLAWFYPWWILDGFILR